jgi:hypothetical protein
MIVKEIRTAKAHLYFVYCPACKHAHQYEANRWKFNGNFDKPTFTPSMLEYYEYNGVRKFTCHTFLTDGIWQFLGDCTHALKNTTHPVIPFPDNYGFGDHEPCGDANTSG